MILTMYLLIGFALGVYGYFKADDGPETLVDAMAILILTFFWPIALAVLFKRKMKNG